MTEAWCDNAATTVGGRTLNAVVPLLCFCPCELILGGGGERNVCLMPGGGGGILFGSTRETNYCLVSEMKKKNC